MKLEFSRQIFEKYSNFINIWGAELFHAEEKLDRHDEVNSRFPKLYESA
jgi:hypothetical protein